MFSNHQFGYGLVLFLNKMSVPWTIFKLVILLANTRGFNVDNRITVIRIGVILPFDNEHPLGHMWSVPKVQPAIEFALEHIRGHICAMPSARKTKLRRNSVRINSSATGEGGGGCVLELVFADSQCSDKYGPLAAIDMFMHQQPSVFIGPACDYAVAPVCRFAPHWDIPVITAGAQAYAFNDKIQYSTTTRILGSYDKLGEFFVTLCQAFNWTVTSLLYEDNAGSNRNIGRSEYHFVVEGVFQQLKKAFAIVKPGSDISYRKLDKNHAAFHANVKRYLRELSLVSRSKFV